MKNLVYLLFSVCVSATSFAQTSAVQKLPLTDAEFQCAVEQYQEMWASQTYIDYQFTVHEFTKKLNGLVMDFDAKDLSVTDKWFEANWQRTQFKSLEELQKERKASVDKFVAIAKERTELFELITRANRDQIAAIIAPERKGYMERFSGR